MHTKKEHWNLTIIDALPKNCDELHSLAAVDLYENGQKYIITGGKEGMYWHCPKEKTKGVICERGAFHVGLAAADLNGDGILEIYAAEMNRAVGIFKIVCFVVGDDINKPWKKLTIDNYCTGNPHDIVFADIDGDGVQEMIAVAAYTKTPGLFVYKLQEFPNMSKHQIMSGHLTEGISVADLDGDGNMEIIAGADYYHMPKNGCYSGEWVRKTYAKSFRDMCRTAAIDITGNGRCDIVIVESEYCEGKLSWFENKLSEKENCFIEHEIDDEFVFAHSLQAKKTQTGVEIMLAEKSERGRQQPYNADARVLMYSTANKGKNWQCEELYHGQGTHQAVLCDIDGDGEDEIVGKTWQNPVVQIFKKHKKQCNILNFKHEFIDRDKQTTSTNIFGAKILHKNFDDIVCGNAWYDGETYEKHDFPVVHQALCAFDVDGDGTVEIIGTKKRANSTNETMYFTLGNELVCLKSIDPKNDIWEIYEIGTGSGPWPHAVAISNKLLENGNTCLALAYHNSNVRGFVPELFECKKLGELWEKTLIGDENYNEGLVIADLNGDGKQVIVSGTHWYEQVEPKVFKMHRYTDEFFGSRIVVADVNGDGVPDIIAVNETCDYETRKTPFGKIVWFENPKADTNKDDENWKMQTIDALRSPHSLSVCDIDNDGIPEVIAAEHDPFKPYRSRCKLVVYKNSDKKGLYWERYTLDDRFEHHVGAKIIDTKLGRKAIVSHGWADTQFVHIWKE